MKKIITVFFLSVSMGSWAQTSIAKEEKTTPVNIPQTAQRTTTSSVKTETSAPAVKPYDENDMYMGRKNEFLNSMIVTEPPADFPKYQKEWSVKDYNAVVDAYYTTHLDILKERPKQKILLLIQQQK